MRKTALILTTCLLLAGCAAGQRPGTAVTDRTATPGERLLVMEYDRVGSTLRAIDASLLADLPGYQPMPLRDYAIYGLSPDGKTLAAVSWANNRQMVGELHLIDLDGWQDRNTGVRWDPHIGLPFFSSDSKSLYWTQPTVNDPVPGPPGTYALVRYNMSGSGQQAEPVVRFPAPFLPQGERFVGDRIAVYGSSPDQDDNRPDDAPHVMLVDIAGRRITADIRLDGIATGFQRAGDQSLLSYQPGLAWDVPHSKLYVAEAARDRVTVVDLAAGAVLEQKAVRPRTSLGNRLHNWLLPTAEAKEMAGVVREALLSPDGSRLYLSGWRHGSPSAGEPLPIQAVATKDMAASGQAVMLGMEVTLSPDGRYLLVGGFRVEEVRRDGNVVDVRHPGTGLTVLDAADMYQLAHLEPETLLRTVGFSMDGRQAFVEQPPEPGRTGPVLLRRFDLESRKFVTSRAFDTEAIQVVGLLSGR